MSEDLQMTYPRHWQDWLSSSLEGSAGVGGSLTNSSGEEGWGRGDLLDPSQVRYSKEVSTAVVLQSWGLDLEGRRAR